MASGSFLGDSTTTTQNSEVGLYQLTGEVQKTPTNTLISALAPISGNINVRRSKERSKYNDRVLGTDGLDVPPSWTQTVIGKRHAYVAAALSSSDHEIFRLNALNSGSSRLEISPVAATGSQYYSKSSRFVTMTYKMSASDTQIAPTPGGFPSLVEFASTYDIPNTTNIRDGTTINGRYVFHPVSGTYRNNFAYKPTQFSIDVPDYGKIRDIKVWVEFIHDLRGGVAPNDGIHGAGKFQNGGFGLPATSSSFQELQKAHGLGGIEISLVSPNVVFNYAHPLWNDKKTNTFETYPRLPIGVNSTEQRGIPPTLQGTYLLWAGHRNRPEFGYVFPDLTGSDSSAYFEYDRDIDMRTIFCDSSPNENPRSISSLYSHVNHESPGASRFWTDRVINSKYSSPTSASYARTYLSASENSDFSFASFPMGFMTGTNIPWFYDSRVVPGDLAFRTGSIPGGSPPPGWLSAPGGVAAENEWPTTGSTIGPETIRAVYPLLDDVYVEKIFDRSGSAAGISGVFNIPHPRPQMIGFRPGLRGTEIHGKWKLLIATPSILTGTMTTDVTDDVRKGEDTGIWFRQFRLEFLIDQGQDENTFVPSSRRRHNRIANPPKPGLKVIDVISGSNTWDIGVNYVYTSTPADYGQTVGIVTNTGSLSDDFAVLSRLTGALAVDHPNYGEWYLNNEFGTPFLPISSGTAFPSEFAPLTSEDSADSRRILDQILNPKTKIFTDNTIHAFISRSDTVRTTQDKILTKVQESQTITPAVISISASFNI